MNVFLTAEWRHLAMVNYAADADTLRPYVPFGTELDLFEGQAYVSIIGFLFQKTRLLGVPVPLHQSFEEVNLRLYVRRAEADGTVKRGVAFVQELVPKRAVAYLARAFYNEQYLRGRMAHEVSKERVSFSWTLYGVTHSLDLTALGEALPLEPGSFNQFIAEHYWGYTRQRDGGTIEYAVQHEPWRIRQAAEFHLVLEPKLLYPIAFAPFLKREPRSVFVAEGSPVSVSMPARMRVSRDDLLVPQPSTPGANPHPASSRLPR